VCPFTVKWHKKALANGFKVKVTCECFRKELGEQQEDLRKNTAMAGFEEDFKASVNMPNSLGSMTPEFILIPSFTKARKEYLHYHSLMILFFRIKFI